LPEESDLLFSIAERLGNFVEKKQYNSILAESEEKYSKAFQTSPYAISIARVSDGKFIEVNDSFIKIAGFSHEEILNTLNSHDLWLNAEDRNEVIEDLKQGKKVLSKEYQFKNKQGKILSGLFSAQFVTITNEPFLMSSILDITSIKQTELERHESETLYKAIINASPDIITITDLNGTVIYVSPKAYEMFGYQRNENFINHQLLEFIAPEDRERAQSQILKMLDGILTGSDVYKAIKADNSFIYIDVNGEFIRDEKGNPNRMIFVIRDVSQRVISEQALIKSEEKFKTLFFESPDGYLILRDGRFIECNKAAEKLIGGSKQQIIGFSPDQLSPEFQPNGVNSTQYANHLIQETFKKGKNSFTWQYNRFDGKEVHFQINLKVITYDGEKALLSIWQDITEKRKTQMALQESETRFSQIAQQSKTVIWEVNAEGLYTYVNDLSETIYGFAPHEIIGKKHFYDLHPEKGPGNFKNAVLKLFNKKEPFIDFHNQIATKDKRTIWLSTNAIPIIDSNNNLVGYRGADNEITDKVEALEELRNFRTITDQANYGMAITDLNGYLIYSNNAFANMHGYEVHEILGHDLLMLHNEAQIIHVKDKLNLLKKQGGFSAEEVWRTRKDGTTFPSLMNAKVIFDDENKPRFLSASTIDISELKEAENLIRKSEEELNYAQELAKMGSWEFNVTTGEVSWSKNFYKLIGHDPSKPPLSLDEIEKALHPDDWDMFKLKIADIIKNKSLESIYFSLIKSDGSLMWIRSNMVPNFENDELVSIQGVSIDITDKKEAEGKIRQQNIRLNAIIEAIPDLIFISDDEGNYLEYFGPNSEDLLISKEKIIGANVKNVFDAHTADLHIKMLKQCLEQKSLVTFDYYLSIAGNQKFFEARLVPLDEQRVLSFVRDISERKIQEREIRKLSLAVKQSPVLVEITDLNANIEYVNPAFVRTTGYTNEELIGKNTRILKSGLTKDAVYKNLWKTIKQGKTWFGEWINKRKNGEFYWESVSITPIYDETGIITNYLGIKQDITKRKETEQEILELNANLERKVEERTSELAKSNASLLNEIEERRLAEVQLKQLSARLTLALRAGKFGVWDYDVSRNILYWDNQMFDLYGIKEEDFSGAYDAWKKVLHPDDQIRGDQEIQMAIRGEKEFDTEFRVVWPDGSIHYIKALAAVQRDDSGKALHMIGTNWDITVQKRAADFERELLLLSPTLTGLSLDKINDAIQQALGRIGEFLSADRSYIFEFDATESKMSNTYEWCNKGINPEIENLQDVPCEAFPRWIETLHRHENIVIASVKDLPESWRAEREILEPQGIQSLIAMPILAEDKLIGFVGLDTLNERKEYNNSEINILKVWCSMLASLINNQRSERLLEQTRQNYETFFNTIDDFLWVLDDQGNIIHTNNTIKKRLEYTTEELINQSVLMVHPAERRQEAGRIVGEMLAGSTEYCPVPIVTKSGKQIPVETRVKPGFWNGIPVIFGVSKDITQIKLSEQKFSSAFQSNSAMMAISEFDSGKFMDVNNAFLETLGFSRDEIIGKTSDEFKLYVDQNDRDIVRNFDQKSPIRKIEVHMLTKSGQIKTGLLSADYIYIGETWCLLTVTVDITERKKAEEELKAARIEAEQANLAKSEFLSRMSHELRTPMNSILGFAQLLEMAELNPTHVKGVKHILKSGKHLLNLINEVLDISRIESGHISISIEPVQIGGALTEVIDIVQPLANQHQIAIERISSHVDLLYIKSDKQKLKQVLLNLLSNAIKYNRQGGSVMAKTVHIGNKVRIEVSDTGMGISEANISKIYIPFERIGAEKTTTEGTGLGLAVVKKLMDAMGGNIGVESVLNEGTTFWIEFPVTESQYSIVEKTSGKIAIIKEHAEMNGLVLYIEDNSSNIELVEQILSEQFPGVRMIFEMNGMQGVKMATELKPDLIFLDLNLPDMHGSEVLKLLQENANTKHIPVVVISADAMPHQKQKLLKIGAKDYLTKPLEVYSFLRLVELWLKKKGLNPKTKL